MINGKWLGLWGLLKLWKSHALVLYYAWKHPRTPLYLRAAIVAPIIYLVSPVDILPDYLPLLGMVDDITIITAALTLLPVLLPRDIYRDCLQASAKWDRRLPWIFGLIVVFIIAWMIVAIWGIHYLFTH